MESQLRFIKPWKSESDASIKVEKIDENSTRLSWGFSGVNTSPAHVIKLFFNMTITVVKNFQEGLGNLKN